MTSTLVVSASRLIKVACERKYAGHYLFDLREESGPGAMFGTDFHSACEGYQRDGNMGVQPESTIGKLLRSGSHFLRKPGSDALIEWEHRGELPDGTEYVAYLDASDRTPCPHTGTLVIDDQKTTSDASRAHTTKTLAKDLQGGFYAWIMYQPHWCAPTLPDGHYGPAHWRRWDPTGIRSARLNWNYFLTRGSPRAWQVPAFLSREQADAHLDACIMPLVERVKAIHAAHADGRISRINDAARDLAACGGVGTWCGAADECDFNKAGTSALIQLTTKPKDTTTMGLAELRAKYGVKKAEAPAPVVEAAAEPEEENEAEVVEVAATPAIVHVSVPARTRRTRTAPPAEPPAPAGDTINPPEAKTALANIAAEVVADNAVPAPSSAEAFIGAEYLFQLAQLQNKLPHGVTITITGGRA